MKVCTICEKEKEDSCFRKYRNSCKECCRQEHREWNKKNKEYIQSYNEKYYKENIEYNLSRSHKWNEDNADRRKQQNSEQYHKKRLSNLERVKLWYRENKQKKQEYHRTRRARELQVGGIFTAQEWNELLQESNYRCLKCGVSNDLSQDHVIPISKGGPNTKENSQVLCRSCNASKGTKTIDYRKTERKV